MRNELVPKANGPPAMYETSPESIRKQIVQISLGHPLTWVPTAIGIGSAIGGLILNYPLLYLIALIGLIGPASFISQSFIFSDRLEIKIRRALRMLAEEQSRQKVEKLKDRLKEVDETRGAEQLGELQRSLHRFHTKLDEEIGPKKPEYEQFLQSAQLMYLAAVNNLEMVVSNALDAQVIDQKGCETRLRKLQKEPEKNQDEIQLLERKIACLKDADEDSDELLHAVEGAITTLLENTRALSEYNVNRQSMGNALEKFSEVADRNRRIRQKANETWNKLNKLF